MNRSLTVVAATMAALMNAGCAILSSASDTPAEVRTGMTYMLPKALLPLDLVESDGVLLLRVQTAKLVGDPKHRYLLRSSTNAFSNDDVKVEVDVTTGLLSKVTITSTDETLAVLKEAASLSSLSRAEASAGASTETVLFRGLLDPDNSPDAATRNARMLSALQAVMSARLDHWKSTCGQKDADATQCATANSILPHLSAKGSIIVEAKPLALVAASGTNDPLATSGTKGPAVDCGIGICHRSLQPYAITLQIGNHFAQSTVVQLPNGGDPVALPLARAAFVKTEHTVELENGQLKSVHTKRPSSALQLVKWPLDVYAGVIDATSRLVQLRIGENAKEVELAQSNLTTAKELKRLREELAALGLAKESSPQQPLTGPRLGDALLAVEFGVRRPVARPDLIPTGSGGAPGKPGQSSPGTGQTNPTGSPPPPVIRN